jgi:hypothetical protein
MNLTLLIEGRHYSIESNLLVSEYTILQEVLGQGHITMYHCEVFIIDFNLTSGIYSAR